MADILRGMGELMASGIAAGVISDYARAEEQAAIVGKNLQELIDTMKGKPESDIDFFRQCNKINAGKLDHSRLTETLRRACIERHIGFPIVNRPGPVTVNKFLGFYWADGEEE